MGAITQPQGTRTVLTTTAMDSLASGAYVSCGTITFATNDPTGAKLEIKATPGTVSGNRQLVVFAKQSLDGTNFESGPSSGTTTTDEPNLTLIGYVPLKSNATAQTKILDLVAAFAGELPYAAEIIVKNDSGAALAASGHWAYYAEITGNAA